ncbi:putative phage tail protein [Clostridium senegalense]|uniref:putative phage tail protein n=1 Tax=Clostridium senegalense TaxID=1465809 RepID=UPI0002899041|nr:putative phage tail protein [Clostridium senegalense]
MKKKLIDFLPSKIANIAEFKEIMNAEDIEFDSIESMQLKILKENFIDTATDYGISKRESLYKIKPDKKNESLDFRRLRLKNRKMDKMPITHRALEQKLETLFGEDNYKVEVQNDDYLVKVFINTFDWNAFNEITDNFRNIIPCNMILKSSLVQKIKSNIYFGACTTIGEELTIYPWSPKSIESKGTVKFALGSNTGVENITIYPKE